jgi:Flp pilus assembly protein TadG
MIPAAYLSRRRASRHAQRGIAAVEFGLVAMVLLTLLMGAVEFGRAMNQYAALTRSVRSAVRHLSTQPAGDATQITEAKNLAVYGSTTTGTTALVHGLTTAQVSVLDATSSTAHTLQPTGSGTVAINLVEVRISGVVFQPLASWLVPAFTFAPISATMRQAI